MPKTNYVLAEEPIDDLVIAEAMVAELEEYLVNDELYRTLIVETPSGDQNMRMTAGDLLTRLFRLQGQRDQLTPEQQTRLDTVQKQVDTVIHSLHTRFLERLQREMKARLDSLRWFLDDCDEDLRRCRTEFPFEMRNRQRIEEILKQLGEQAEPDLLAVLKQIDRRIRQATHGSSFIWDERLQEVFAPQPYWYLYVTP